MKYCPFLSLRYIIPTNTINAVAKVLSVLISMYGGMKTCIIAFCSSWAFNHYVSTGKKKSLLPGNYQNGDQLTFLKIKNRGGKSWLAKAMFSRMQNPLSTVCGFKHSLWFLKGLSEPQLSGQKIYLLIKYPDLHKNTSLSLHYEYLCFVCLNCMSQKCTKTFNGS